MKVLTALSLCSLILFSCANPSSQSAEIQETTSENIDSDKSIQEDSVIVESQPVEADTLQEAQETGHQLTEAQKAQMQRDRDENEKFRIAELERRRKLAEAQGVEYKPYQNPEPKPVAKTAPAQPKTVKQPTAPKSTVQNETPKQKPKTSTKTETVKTAHTTATTTPEKKPNIRFEELTFEFDTITEGDVVSFKFHFQNTGSGDLEINNAKGTCGCTQPSFPFIPIPGGESGYIGVTFDSKTKFGKQTPEVEVYTNIREQPYILYLNGYVLERDKETEAGK